MEDQSTNIHFRFNQVTWAGQSFKNAKPHGKEVIETVAGGVVKLRDSEGLLVFLRGKPYSA
jgi:hypothetical protein